MARPKKVDQAKVLSAIADLLVCGGSAADWAALCVEHKVSADSLERLKQQARNWVRSLAKVDTEFEFAVAKQRLDATYAAAMTAGDHAPAVAAQRALNQLLNLLTPTGEEGQGELELTAAVELYLHPLELTEKAAPPVEHVRLAAQRIMELSARTDLRIVG